MASADYRIEEVQQVYVEAIMVQEVSSHEYSEHGQGHPVSAAGLETEQPVIIFDIEDLSNENPFADAAVRRGFIKKVYGLLFTQLAFTFGVVIIFTTVVPIKTYVRDHPASFYTSFGLFLVINIAFKCLEEYRKKTPWNFICLGIFTLSFTYMLAVISSFFTTYIVVVGAAMTMVLTMAIALFSLQPWITVTTLRLFLFMVLCMIVLVVVTCVVIIYGVYGGVLDIVIGSLICFIFFAIILHDFHMVVGNKEGYEIDPEEYVFATLQIYVHVVYLFIIILALLGGGSNN